MIALRSASLAFGDKTLFSGLDLQVDRGQLVGITGESGCGKTSLLRAILGFVPLTAGTIEVCGLPLDTHHIHAIRQQTAYVPQELQPPAENGRALIALTHELAANRGHHAHHSSPSSTSPSSTSAGPTVPDASPSGSQSSLLSSLALDSSLLDLSASKLSGGQRQRLLLLAALSLTKPLLLLDEPTSALDEDSSQRVGLALQRACHEENRAALVVSHDPVLLAFCDKQVTLGNVLS